jgi:hypothetical protein
MSFLFPSIPLPARERRPGWTEPVRVRAGRHKILVTHPAEIVQPLAVSYGMGTDSTALLVLMVEQVQRTGNRGWIPDRIQFADTGSEKDITYPYLETINHYLERSGFPTVTVVRRKGQDRSLSESCLRLKTLPSLAFGGKSCSLKFKAAAMETDLARQSDTVLAWHAGMPVLKLIGYDGSPQDMRRSTNPGDDRYRFHYPLREAGLRRDFLMQVIDAAGLPQPGKSACFMCPAMKRPEVEALARTEPHNAAIALRMEARAMLRTIEEKETFSTKGLGRTWAWRDHLAKAAPELLKAIIDSQPDGAGESEWQAYLVHTEMRAALV